MAYENLKKLYDKNVSTFGMSVAYLLDKGFTFVRQITDEDIETLEENPMMTKDFVQNLARLARDIAKECGNNVVEIIQFCQAESVFDTKFYAPDKGMKICKNCREAMYSHGEQFKVIKYYGNDYDDEEEECEWCGEIAECDTIEY